LDLVHNSWDSPSPDGEIAAFKKYVFHYMRISAKDAMRFKVGDDAYKRFDLGWQSSTRYTPLPETLVQIEPEGQACPETDQAYELTVHVR
jgi:hypothetical protein